MAAESPLEVVMPQMGDSVSEGTVTRWLRNIGDTVKTDESLLEISTDKVDTEVPSPGGGVLKEILVSEGETVAVGTLLARIDRAPIPAPDEQPEPPEPVVPDPEPPAPVAAVPELPTMVAADLEASSEPAAERSAFSPASDDNGTAGHPSISPVVARIASEHGVDLSTLEGSGRDGRVTKKDVLAFIDTAADAGTEPEKRETPSEEPAAPRGTPPEPAPVQPVDEAPLAPGESLTPLSIMRRGIAEHMRRSLDTAAHVTSAIEVDMSRVAAIRERIKQDFSASYGVNPTYLAFIARATVDTLRDWPWINAELRADAVLTRTHVNLGVAVSLEGGKGLIVPVLKHAEGLNLLGMARGIADLADRARTRKLLPDDVQGGTFTITNPGGYGTLLGTPIISQPQSAILGTYAIVKRPWVISDDGGQDAIAIRSIMNLTLTYDHRLVDGAYAAQFLRDLAGRLQSWSEADY